MSKARVWSKEEELWLRENISYNPVKGTFYNKCTGKFIKPPKKNGGYSRISRCINGRGCTFLSHRVAWFLHYGKQTEFFIDHINRETSDNRIVNLRECDYSQNNANRGPRRADLLKGVRIVTMYEAVCKNEVVGLFKCRIEAAKAYDAEAIKVFGDFAYTNKQHGVY